ncbi:MAG: hypothetical protein QNL04_05440 [SAR324 cluster bacterium]|nr:hypothetical protein [SAR324 cluster bacterium]
MNKKRLFLLVICLFFSFISYAATPKIKAIGLSPLSETTKQKFQAAFYFSAGEPIAKITINGLTQKIAQGQRRLTLFVQLQLNPGANLIMVEVTDQKGNTSKEQYDITLKGMALIQDILTPKVKGYKLVMGLHQDDNPSLDMSTGNYEGVTNNDQQEATRSLVNVAALWEYLGFEGEAGIYDTRYNHYHDDLTTTRLYLAANRSENLGGGQDWLLGYQFTDENKGGYDYSMNHLFSTGLRFSSLNQYGQKQFLLLKGNVQYIDFASPFRTDGIDFNLQWDYKLISRDYQYSYNSLFTIGTRNEGVTSFSHSYLGADLHWTKRLDQKVEMDLGFESEYRMYPDNPLSTSTPLGTAHVDIPMELSLLTHWQFNPTWRITGNASYILSLSNKIPYDRRFYGLTFARDF